VPGLIIAVIFMVVFWIMIIRPQQQQRRTHQATVADLHVGERVMTVGGLIGTLTAVDPETVRIDTGDGTELTFGRTFIRQRLDLDPSTAPDDGAAASDPGDPR
jgi:preprotein translocase subunit YajC